MDDSRAASTCAFKEYNKDHEKRILGGHADGSVSFQLAQAQVSQGKVPISIVLYIDATFLKRGIPIRPIYCKYIVILLVVLE
jgi:hypothetical protein